MEPNFEMFERPDAYDHHPYDGDHELLLEARNVQL
jgi:hypothetical protein